MRGKNNYCLRRRCFRPNVFVIDIRPYIVAYMRLQKARVAGEQVRYENPSSGAGDPHRRDPSLRCGGCDVALLRGGCRAPAWKDPAGMRDAPGRPHPAGETVMRPRRPAVVTFPNKKAAPGSRKRTGTPPPGPSAARPTGAIPCGRKSFSRMPPRRFLRQS